MGYEDIEALWLTRVRAMSEFNQNNSSRGDWSMLNNGRDEKYAILKPGQHIHEWMTTTVMQHTYRTIIQVWYRYGNGDGTALTALTALETDIRTELYQYRLLADSTGTVQDADIVETREVVQIPADGPEWLMVELVGECQDEETITFAE